MLLMLQLAGKCFERMGMLGALGGDVETGEEITGEANRTVGRRAKDMLKQAQRLREMLLSSSVLSM